MFEDLLVLPHGSIVDEELMAHLVEQAADLSRNSWGFQRALSAKSATTGYDAAVLFARRLIRQQESTLLKTNPIALLSIWEAYGTRDDRLRVARALSRDRDATCRAQAIRLLQQLKEHGGLEPAWDWSAWTKRTSSGRLGHHRTGNEVLEKNGLPTILTIGQLREALGIPSTGQLGYLLLAHDQDQGPYRTFLIPKKRGGERLIAAPKKQLRQVQKRILAKILAHVPIHESAHGFVPGRSTRTNAAPHVKKGLIVKFDLKDFFPTIGFWRVVGLFAQMGFPVGNLEISRDDESESVAPTLARLCIFNPEVGHKSVFGKGQTPQGAPTSPAISNLICRQLDRRLTGLARSMSGDYTRYADDLTFSFVQAPSIGRLRWWVNEICRQEGFVLNHDKFRVIRSSQCQKVTGIVVNDMLRVPRKQRRRFRAILHNCRKYGVASQARGQDNFTAYLMGFASYIHMVHPEEGRGLLDEVAAILEASP